MAHNETPQSVRRHPEKDAEGNRHGDSWSPAEDGIGPRLGHDCKTDLLAEQKSGCLFPTHGSELDVMAIFLLGELVKDAVCRGNGLGLFSVVETVAQALFEDGWLLGLNVLLVLASRIFVCRRVRHCADQGWGLWADGEVGETMKSMRMLRLCVCNQEEQLAFGTLDRAEAERERPSARYTLLIWRDAHTIRINARFAGSKWKREEEGAMTKRGGGCTRIQNLSSSLLLT